MDGFKCEGCNLTIEKNDGKYCYAKPGFAVPIKLQEDPNVVKQAYETALCPLCGREMKKV